MKKTIVVALGLLVIAIINGVTGVAAGGNDVVTVNEAYNGKQIELCAGDTLKIELESNPTTGFMWTLVANSGEGVLQKVDNSFEADKTVGPAVCGAGGKEVWTFKALAAGETTVSMEYSQNWEGGIKAVQSFDLTVVIK